LLCRSRLQLRLVLEAEVALLLLAKRGLVRGLLRRAMARNAQALASPRALLVSSSSVKHLGEVRPLGQLLEVIDFNGRRQRGEQVRVVLLVGLREWRGLRQWRGLIDVEPVGAVGKLSMPSAREAKNVCRRAPCSASNQRSQYGLFSA
jgi:hypothetical protein